MAYVKALHLCEFSEVRSLGVYFQITLFIMMQKDLPFNDVIVAAGGLILNLLPIQLFLFLLARLRRISAFIFAAPDPCKPVI